MPLHGILAILTHRCGLSSQKTEIVALHDAFVKHNLDKIMEHGNINKVWGHASARAEGMGVLWGVAWWPTCRREGKVVKSR